MPIRLTLKLCVQNAVWILPMSHITSVFISITNTRVIGGVPSFLFI